jgi:hypothetical protein
MFRRFWRWITGGSKDSTIPLSTVAPKLQTPARRLPDVAFDKVELTSSPPSDSAVAPRTLYLVGNPDNLKWLLLKCPCGCKAVITLSLRAIHNPHWKVFQAQSGRFSLHPSVWRDVGCMSHFVMRDGRVFWADDTGTSPNTWWLRNEASRGYREHDQGVEG